MTPPSHNFYPVTGAQGRFVGFGTAASCDGDVELCSVTGAFYSDDGVDWFTATPDHDAFTDPQGRTIRITSVTPYLDGFAAMGSIVDEAAKTVVGGVWLSKDGTAWTVVDMPPIDLGAAHAICEGAGYVFGNLAVAAVGDHLIAEGFRDGPRYCHSKRERIAFSSNDGTRWQPLNLPDLDSRRYPVSLLGGRQFVWLTQGDGEFAVWVSADGESWQKGALELPRHASLYTIVETPDGYLAFGQVGTWPTESQLTLASADALRWEVVADQALPADWQPISRAVLVGDTVVAVGVFGKSSGPILVGEVPISGVIETEDGATWTVPETDAFSGYYVYPLISDGTAVIANGQDFNNLDEVLFVKSYP